MQNLLKSLSDLVPDLNTLQLYIMVIGMIINYIWIRVAMKQNGSFSKRETIQLLLINMAVVMLASELGSGDFDTTKWGMALGSLVISEGMSVYEVVKLSGIKGIEMSDENDNVGV